MKKTISITLGGLLFQIEEDGYDQLRTYLDQVHRYFSTFKDSREILADIETRIAELFIAKHPDRLESVTKEDVESIIATLGSVEDFASEEEESQPTPNQPFTNPDTETKVLRRNVKLQMLGGVCAGIAQNLNISALWVRLAFLALFLGFGWLPFIPLTMLAIYICLWVALPPVFADESKTVRKFFRSKKNKVIGGVCGGLAQYFAIDISVVRLLALLSIVFFGSGILIYISIWAVSQEANSLTDEMQMTGTPINLASIEDTIKRNLQSDPKGQESELTRVVLLPFRLIGAIITGLVPIAKLIFRGIAIFIGSIILLTCLSLLFGIFLAIMASLHVIDWASIIHDTDFPVESVMNSVPQEMVYSIGAVAVIPVLLIGLLGLQLLFSRPKLPAAVPLTMLGIWILCIGWMTITIIQYSQQYRFEGKTTSQILLPLPNEPLKIRMGLDDADHTWSSIRLRIEHWEGDSIKIVRSFQAKGTDISQAKTIAKKITHQVALRGSELIIDGRYELPTLVPFRYQEVEVKVYLPKNTKFTVSKYFTTNIQNLHWDNYSTYKRLSHGEFRFSSDTLIFNDNRAEPIYLGRALADENGEYHFPSPKEEDTDED